MTRLESRLKKLEETVGNTDGTIVREVVINGEPSIEIETRRYGKVVIKRIVGVPLDAL
jgi:predicted DNA-binding protein